MRPSTHLGLLALLCLFAGSEEAYGQTSVCYNHLSRTTYDNGFSLSDFSSSSGVSIVNGALELDTDERQLGDANRISVNTRQKLTAHYVYESAGASHTFGWFIWDNAMDPYVTPSGWNFTTRTCSSAGECDPGMSCVLNGATRYCAYPKYVLRDDGVAADTWAGNAAFDWFEALYVKTCKTCTPLLLTSPYSDASRGGTMNHVPNLLETLVNQRGGWVFLLADDDTDTDAYQNLPPVADVRTTHDGIPDYDVNGDGVINALDRTVELGTFDSGSELVFFLVVYYEQRPRKSSMGMQGTLTCPSPCTSNKRNCTWCKANCSPEQWGSSCDSTNNCRNCRPYYAQNPDEVDAKIIPYFSKRVLNPDFTSSGNGSFQRDIGCAYDPNDPPIKCGGYEGWLDQAALNRLSSLYGLNIPHEVKTINYRMGGQSDHVFIGAPSTEPNWWILGFEDLYDHGDKDFNDLVFLVFRTNGGEVVSNDLVTELTPDQKASSTITKVRFKKRDMIPTPPCSTDPDKVRIEYYISISADQNGSPIWFKIDFPPGSDEAIIDMQDLGAAGAELRWKAAIITDDHLCKPQILDVDVGYEAMKSGEYLFTSPLPLANTLFRAGLETRSPSWTVTASDYSNRGHFRMYELYSPSTPDTMTKTQIWDAGAALAARNPDTRTVFTHQNGTKELLSSAASAWTLSQVLSSSDRAERLNGRLVYDLDGDGDSDDDDARYLIQWTRGWEIPSTQQRAWKLGAINKSTAAVVHVPGDPDWMSKVAIPTTIRTAYRDWVTQPAIAERRTIAYVGSQSGMLHAFDAGEFRWGDNPDTGILENRGYFKYTTGVPTYGNGSEKFAYVPPTLIGDLKNNRVRNYFPETHPQAMVEGSVVVSDLYGVFPFSPAPEVAQWRTAVAFSLGRLRPAISALDVTDPNDPRPLWATDWTDSDFHGTNAAPTLSFVPGSTAPTWGMAVTSGLSDTPVDLYLYLVDAVNGATSSKVKLNQGLGSAAEQAYGVAGRAVFVDYDDNGVADRVYAADTNGRVWRVNLEGSGTPCLVVELGQAVFHTPAFLVREDSSNQRVVTFYLGTADHPYQADAPEPPYWFYAFADEDQTSTECNTASLLWKYQLPSDEKIWADPSIAAEVVYAGTATGDRADICDEDTSNPGSIYPFDLDPTSEGQPNLVGAPVSAGGNVLAGLLVFDQHIILNTVGGTTSIIGGSSWNNLSGLVGANQMKDTYWNEVVNK